MARLLVIDDTDDIRLLLHAVLKRAGFEVTEAANGGEALEILRRDTGFDAIVLDIQMPDMDGWEVLARIRADSEVAHIPVVLCTVKSQIDDSRRGWELGADGFLRKPFSIADVPYEVQAVLGLSADERERRRKQAVAALAEGDR
ncbi:MAG TPA: response regulator [Acidimicrobiales bacterium]|nr:response regulator [Acidimicrobiales bacterium]